MFPNRASAPTFMFYDNNCNLRRHLTAQNPNDHLLKMGLVVDVFHHQNKHKQNTEECEKYCNPACYQDLKVVKNGQLQWRFNSSVCEQQNSWIVKFQPMLREMGESVYTFFLDEVIRIRNDELISKLRRQGHNPYFFSDKAQ